MFYILFAIALYGQPAQASQSYQGTFRDYKDLTEVHVPAVANLHLSRDQVRIQIQAPGARCPLRFGTGVFASQGQDLFYGPYREYRLPQLPSNCPLYREKNRLKVYFDGANRVARIEVMGVNPQGLSTPIFWWHN